MLERPRQVRRLLRLSLYIAVVFGLFVLRGRIDLKDIAKQDGSGATDTTLVIAGADLAPTLVHYLVDRYRLDYPQLNIQVRGGSTTAALQELVNGRADAVFLGRPPTAQEQEIFVKATGDTVYWTPAALSALVVVASPSRADSAVSVPDLRALASGHPAAGAQRLYVADPNTGLWDAFRAKLDLPLDPGAAPASVVFLADDTTVVAAVQADEQALGVVSRFVLPKIRERRDLLVLAVQQNHGAAKVEPLLQDLASGDYPLWSYLYIGCRSAGEWQGAKFVTHVASARGQRQIEWTDFLPARLVPREVYIDRLPPGAES
jgi:ABC-type phosphate transport system substrate-binding protein